MSRRLRIACWDYDRVAPLIDGRVKVEGCDVEFAVSPPHGFFFRAGEEPPFEVMEQSMSSYLTRRSRGPTPYTAIPAFPARMFRHSAIYIRTDRGIEAPSDLTGRRIGVPLYGITAAMTARGILSDEYGVRAEDIIWVNGALEAGDRHFTQDLGLPQTIRIEQAPEGKTLSAMLAAGEIDGLVTAAAPSTRHAPGVGPLFRDCRAVEQEYFRKTGVFPIMHAIGIKTELLREDPSLALRVYRAFCEAKNTCMKDIEGDGGAVKAAVPWLLPELAVTRAIMGADYWPYGLEKNRKALEAVTRWSFEQHLSPRKLAPEELFSSETVGVTA